MPTAGLTAELALRSLGGLRGGVCALVCDAGGAGAAVAQLLARSVFGGLVTSGCSHTRALLRLLHVTGGALGTRDAGGALLACTAGVGVVIGSAAAATMTAATLASLAAGGAYVELGKRAVWSTRAVCAERRDVLYSLVSADLVASAAGGRMMSALACALARGVLTPPGCATYALGRARQAVACLAQAGHVGQVVLSQRAGPWCCRSRATVVTGGLGALGSLVALWLVQQGAGRVVVLGRSGRASAARGRLWQQLLSVGRGSVVAGRCELTASEDLAAQRRCGSHSDAWTTFLLHPSSGQAV